MHKVDKAALRAAYETTEERERSEAEAEHPGRRLRATPASKPIKLGGALVTMVEPHKGHEVAYNRWYERDHFYAGCQIGAWNLAGDALRRDP